MQLYVKVSISVMLHSGQVVESEIYQLCFPAWWYQKDNFTFLSPCVRQQERLERALNKKL